MGILGLCLLCGCRTKTYEFSGGFETKYEDADDSGTQGGEDMVLPRETDTAAAEREKESATDRMPDPSGCYVHICGAVMNPGVYCVTEGSRLYEVILAAGGMTADAMDEAVNQAQEVTDGMQVYIPSRTQETAGEGRMSGQEPLLTGNAGATAQDTRIDLNTAGVEALCTLPGIGETRARAIIAYREEHGAFQSTGELMNVTGIKAGVYEKIKELIKV